MIRRNDPRRRHLHDFFLVDPFTGRDLGGFDSQTEAMAYAVAHLRGRVTVCQRSARWCTRTAAAATQGSSSTRTEGSAAPWRWGVN